MAASTTPLRIDPFFDGESPALHQQPAAGGLIQPNIGEGAVNRGQPAPAYQPGYVDATVAMMGDDRVVARVIPRGPAGLHGTVIPRAVEDGGVPLESRLHETANVEVVIDPHLEGQSTTVRLGDVSREALERATIAARAVTPEPFDTATRRLRASAIMQAVAAQAAAAGAAAAQHQAPPVLPAQPAGGSPAPPQPQIATPAWPAVAGAARTSRPLAHFGPALPDQQRVRPLRAVEMDSTPPEYSTDPPSLQVTFEIAGFGLHKAYYHDVIVDEGFLVLVYDERYTGGVMYEPPAGETAPSLALEIVGGQQVHLVHTTGFSYSYQKRRFCVLMIERSAPLQPASEEPGGQQ